VGIGAAAVQNDSIGSVCAIDSGKAKTRDAMNKAAILISTEEEEDINPNQRK